MLAISPGYSLFDAYHGGGGGSVAAIMAGIFVKAGADIAEPEIHQFERLAGRTSLGDILSLVTDRIPNVHTWLSCSSCKDFCPLGSCKSSDGAKGGNHFIQQFLGAKAANARVVVIENVDGVSTLHDGTALHSPKIMLQNVVTQGFTQRGLYLQSTVIQSIEHAGS